jgi:competence protein ComEA
MDEEGESAVSEFLTSYKWPIVLGIASLFAISCAVVLLLKLGESAKPITFTGIEESSPSALSRQVVVDVEGAVARPGVYQLAEGSRVEDLIATAGGLTQAADDAWVGKSLNRAALLQDGGKLFIPEKSEKTPSSSSVNTPASFGSAISLNTASETELDSLSGVGPVTVKKIIDGRPYQRIEEILERKIVGASVFEKIKEQLTL